MTEPSQQLLTALHPVALGFIGQISTVGAAFKVFALTVLPTLYVLGLFTFVRLVQSVATS